jgi:hypothetical protein
MSATEPVAPTPAARRDLRSPFFVFRTPDGIGTYFTSEHLPVLKSTKEPLARFLAGARLVENGTLRSIQYDFEGLALDTARPMEFLPQSEIDAFAAAVRDFYDKAHAATPRIVQHEKKLRAHFRLPDPDLEPDAYWVYGPPHDRQLLILWGCEFKAGTSLPLAPDAELKIPAGRTILDKLQSRVMSWEARQREALKLARKSGEPIARFLARPAVDASGQSAGFVLQGQTIPAKNLKPLKRVLTGELANFTKAARTFYDKAAPEAAGVTAYEKELRRAFRLPDPDKRADAYFLHGKNLVVVLDGKETHEATLPMIDHPALFVATPVVPADGEVVVAGGAGAPGGNVAAKLGGRTVSSGLVYTIAASVLVALAIGGLAAWKFLPDRTPPTVVKYDKKANLDVGLPSSTSVVVRFSEPIAAGSIKAGAADASFRFGDDKAKVEGTPKIDSSDPTLVVLTTSKLIDGEKYELVVRGVADKAGNKLPATPPLGFEFFDVVAPKLTKVSGGPNKNNLTLIFSKPLKPETVTATGNYQLTTQDGSALRVRVAGFDPNDKTGTIVVLEAEKDFSDGLPYRIANLSGLKDTAKQGNFIDFPAKGLDFEYKDIMPPRILEAAGSAGRLEVTLTFTKPVGKEKEGREIAENTANYSLLAPDGTPLVFVPGSARFNELGNVLKLRFDEPAKLAPGKYSVAAKNIRDAKGNVIEEAAVPFEFFDMNDRSPLTVTALGKVVGNQLKLEFSRVLRRADAADRTKFELRDDQQRPLQGITVAQVARVPDSPTQVLLTFSKDPSPGSIIQVSATGVTDIFGNKADQPVRLAKAVAISGVSAASEQVLAWIGRPVLKGNRVTLTIKEEVAKSTAQNLDNYDFTPDSVHLERVGSVKVETDAKSGTRRTIIELVLRSSLLSPQGVKLAVHDLEAEGLGFLGAQNLDAIELTAIP